MPAFKKMNRAQLAELSGVSLVTVDTWVRDGCPYISRPVRKGVGQWEFSAADVFEWRIKREREAVLGEVKSIDEAEARRRKLAAEAGLAELELAKAQGLCVSIDDSARAWAQILGACRAKLLGIPAKLGHQVAIESDRLRCEDLLTESVYEALSELAEGEWIIDPTSEAKRVQFAIGALERIRVAVEGSKDRKLAAGTAQEFERAISALSGQMDAELG